MTSHKEDIEKLTQGTGDETAPSSHTHPEEQILVTTAIEMLKQSETGAKLVKLVENPGLTIHLIKTVQEVSYHPETKEVFIGIPPGDDFSMARITLLLAGALRLAEQELMGIKQPGLDTPAEEKIGVAMGKYADKTAYMCAIAWELHKNERFTEYNFIDEIEKMGHREVIETLMGG